MKTNLAKCSIKPIYGGDDVLDELTCILGCQILEFPIKCLGLSLSTKKIPKPEFQSVVKPSRSSPGSYSLAMVR